MQPGAVASRCFHFGRVYTSTQERNGGNKLEGLLVSLDLTEKRKMVKDKKSKTVANSGS